MYQSIDDPQDEQGTHEGLGKPALIWIAAIAAALALLALIYVYSPRHPATPPTDDALRAEQATYRKAVAEITAPMRRARLQDFLTTYPESGYIPVVEAQLDVINVHEEQSWGGVTDTIFSGDMTRAEKLAILEVFEQDWGGSLLGGRGEEITRLRAEIIEASESQALPDRRLKENPSPIPKSIPDSELAGGPRPVMPPAGIEPAIPPEDTVKLAELDIVPPKIRRNVKPRYPRKAMRRKIGAVVTLSLNIDARGRVALTELVDVDAERYEKDFVKAAERAAMRTRFHPKTVGGKPTPTVGVLKRYRFQVEN